MVRPSFFILILDPFYYSRPVEAKLFSQAPAGNFIFPCSRRDCLGAASQSVGNLRSG